MASPQIACPVEFVKDLGSGKYLYKFQVCAPGGTVFTEELTYQIPSSDLGCTPTTSYCRPYLGFSSSNLSLENTVSSGHSNPIESQALQNDTLIYEDSALGNDGNKYNLELHLLDGPDGGKRLLPIARKVDRKSLRMTRKLRLDTNSSGLQFIQDGFMRYWIPIEVTSDNEI